MRMPRITIRRMMVAVAVVAFLVWGGMEVRRLGRLSRDYRERARIAALWHSTVVKILSHTETMVPVAETTLEKTREYDPDQVPAMEKWVREIRSERDTHLAEIDYWSKLKAKYERAARYPWLPVEPDPPEPQ